MKPTVIFGALLLMILASGCGQPPRGDKGDTGQPGTPGEPGICVVQPGPAGVFVTCPDGTTVHVQDGDVFVCPVPEVVVDDSEPTDEHEDHDKKDKKEHNKKENDHETH